MSRVRDEVCILGDEGRNKFLLATDGEKDVHSHLSWERGPDAAQHSVERSTAAPATQERLSERLPEEEFFRENQHVPPTPEEVARQECLGKTPLRSEPRWPPTEHLPPPSKEAVVRYAGACGSDSEIGRRFIHERREDVLL